MKIIDYLRSYAPGLYVLTRSVAKRNGLSLEDDVAAFKVIASIVGETGAHVIASAAKKKCGCKKGS